MQNSVSNVGSFVIFLKRNTGLLDLANFDKTLKNFSREGRPRKVFLTSMQAMFLATSFLAAAIE